MANKNRGSHQQDSAHSVIKTQCSSQQSQNGHEKLGAVCNVGELGAVCGLQFAVCNVGMCNCAMCVVCSVQFVVWGEVGCSVQCAMWGCALSSVQCLVCSVQCAVCGEKLGALCNVGRQ